MNDEKKPFTVTDRRHFTAEGQSRDEGPAQDPKDADPTPTEPKGEDTQTAEPKAADSKAPRGEAEAGGAPGATGAAGAREEVTFVGFITGLAAQAGMLLGLGAPADSEGEAASTDLDGARHVIGILEMLKDKTEGRCTPEEDRVLEEVLYTLRMAYVHKSGQGGA